MTSNSHSRGRFVAAAAAAGAGVALPGGAWAAGPPVKPEKPSITLGIATFGSNFLTVYVAAARSWKEQGLTVQLVGFRGDSEVEQALVGNSVDISLASMTGLISLVTAQQPVMAFYAGFNQADFAWYAQPGIKTWADLKGKSVGVTTYGSVTDSVTRYALRKHGLDPDHDVTMVQSGGSQSSLQAMQSKRLDATVLSPPFRWHASDAGFTLLGTQERDVGSRWPKCLYEAKTDFVKSNPNTIVAFLRGHVAAIRLARRDKSVGVAALMDTMKIDESDAARSYDAAMPAMDESGQLPTASMPVFWEIAKRNGDVTDAWPESKFLDRRYIDTFARWAP